MPRSEERRVAMRSKSQNGEQRNEEEKNRMFDCYLSWQVFGSKLVLSQPGQFVVFSDYGKCIVPIRIPKIASNGNPENTILNETIHGQTVVVGENTEVVFLRCLENSFDGLYSSGSETIDLSSLQNTGPLTRGSRQNYHSFSKLTVAVSTLNESVPKIVGECGLMNGTDGLLMKYRRAGADALARLMRANGLTGEAIELFLWKMKAMMEKCEIKMCISIGGAEQSVTSLKNSGCPFLTTTRIEIDQAGSSKKLCTQASGYNNDSLLGICACGKQNNKHLHFSFDDQSTAPEAAYQHINIVSDFTIIGDNAQLIMPVDTINTSSANVAIKNTSIHTHEQIRSIVMNAWAPTRVPNVLYVTGQIGKAKHRTMIRLCESLRNSGDFKQHGAVLESYSSTVCTKESDACISLCLEKALALINKNETSKANHCLSLLQNFAVKAKNSTLLLGRIFAFKANIALREKDYKGALNELEKARHYMGYVASGEEKTFLCYLFGVTYMMLASQCQVPDLALENRALFYFDLYLQHARIQEDCGFYVRRGINYVMFQKASIYLRTYSDQIRKFNVCLKAMTQAKKCLEVVKQAIDGKNEPATLIKIQSIESDIAYREGELELARSFLSHGVELSKANKFTPYIVEEALRERLMLLKNNE
ncbi:uncharacterized protein LOC135685093 [Rhopilema esculentum]|uniref:uncharacterized protein LOC135685093 n=1 Tax=Rhopilema esculentum TaxID=499914 RepID=UPI0031DDEEA7|eukprot:gene17715-9376_t